MTVTTPASIHTLKPLRQHPPTSLHAPNGNKPPADPQRLQLLNKAAQLESLARGAAEQGDLVTSARLILEGLDCERRAGGLGLQVLQLIKPRS